MLSRGNGAAPRVAHLHVQHRSPSVPTRLDSTRTTQRLDWDAPAVVAPGTRGAVSCAGSELRGAARRPSLARAARRRAVVAGGAAVARPTRKSRTLEFDQEGLIVGMMLFLFVGPTE